MKTWLKIKDNVVIAMVSQTETPIDDESGFWIIQPNILSGPGWIYENGKLKKPENFLWFVIKKEAFFNRFKNEELQAIRQSTNLDVIKAVEYIDSQEKIYLTSKELSRCITVFAESNLISKSEASLFFEPAKKDEEAEVTMPMLDGETL